MEAQIKKGVLEMCVLHTISRQPMYGYDVMKHMRQFFPEVNESTFYAILRRLHADKKADITLGEESAGPTRKYYKITQIGIAALNENTNSWHRICAAVKSVGITQ